MNRVLAEEVLEGYGRPVFKAGDKTISFARQDNSSIDEIESLTTEDLIKQWKSLVWTNEIYGQVSLNDLQRISLIELEMEDREGINDDDLKSWYDEELKKIEY